jgi:predicted transcriptional regulator
MNLPEEPLSPAQLEIMEIIWDKGEVAAVEVRQLLAGGRELARETVRTMLERMEAKGWLKHRVVGRTFFGSWAQNGIGPLLTSEEVPGSASVANAS